jgi:hypothetical protein
VNGKKKKTSTEDCRASTVSTKVHDLVPGRTHSVITDGRRRVSSSDQAQNGNTVNGKKTKTAVSLAARQRQRRCDWDELPRRFLVDRKFSVKRMAMPELQHRADV